MNNEDERTRCKNDILYFIENYVRVKTNEGNVPLHLTEAQKKYLQHLTELQKKYLQNPHTNFIYGKRRIN